MLELSQHESKTCIECGQPLGAGRKDRKFCNDLCRTAYNNSHRKDKPIPPAAAWRDPYYNKIDQILRRNRDILEQLYLIENINTIARHDLEGFGFNFKYITSVYNAPEFGSYYRFCYDYGYVFNGEIVEIIARPDEIKC